MQIQKDITIADCDERVSVVYTEEKFGTKDTAIAIYDKYRIKRLENIEQYTVFNAAMASTLIAEGACKRKESIGSHYIVD